jgi:hypothetical protein
MSFSSDKYSDELCAQRKCDGDPCQSRALRGERFCHYHKVMGMPKINIDNDPSGHAYLPVFEDAVSIQSAIQDVCEMMLHRRIETKEASILLYAMQVASTNMAHMNGDKGQRKDKDKNNDKSKNKKKTSAQNPPLPPHCRQRKFRPPVPLPRHLNPSPCRLGQFKPASRGGRQAFE